MNLKPCEGCVYRVDTGREWPEGTPYYECHRRAPTVLLNENGLPAEARPAANGMGCGDRAEAIGESAFEVQMRQEVAALERIADTLVELVKASRAKQPIVLPPNGPAPHTVISVAGHVKLDR